jgi:hypothetical protein
MEASARRVRAERNRRRLPERRPAARWTRRILGVVATGVLLAIGVGIALKVMPKKDDTADAATATATATATAHAKKTHHHTHKTSSKTKKASSTHHLSSAQRATRAAAVDQLRTEGYIPLNLAEYDSAATFRVLVGRPVGDASGGEYAFFFEGGKFLGHDAASPSTMIRLAKHSKVALTLTYGVYEQGDKPGAPSGRASVPFELEGGEVHALEAIPSPGLRFEQETD